MTYQVLALVPSITLLESSVDGLRKALPFGEGPISGSPSLLLFDDSIEGSKELGLLSAHPPSKP